MKIKTCELTDVALDWAVAHAMQYVTHSTLGWTVTLPVPSVPPGATPPLPFPKNFSPSTRWAQGGPIAELEKLCIGFRHQLDNMYVPTIDPDVICWARTTAGGHLQYGPTPLIAAMRALVWRKLGDEVDVPDEFVEVKP